MLTQDTAPDVYETPDVADNYEVSTGGPARGNWRVRKFPGRIWDCLGLFVVEMVLSWNLAVGRDFEIHW